MKIKLEDAEKIQRCKRALERRFGQSIMPLAVRMLEPTRVKISDIESGSWAEFDIAGKRIRRIAEFDGADL